MPSRNPRIRRAPTLVSQVFASFELAEVCLCASAIAAAMPAGRAPPPPPPRPGADGGAAAGGAAVLRVTLPSGRVDEAPLDAADTAPCAADVLVRLARAHHLPLRPATVDDGGGYGGAYALHLFDEVMGPPPSLSLSRG